MSTASKTIVNSKCIVKCLQLDCVAACIATEDKNIIGAPQHFSHLLSDISEALVKPIPYRVSSSLGCGLSCLMRNGRKGYLEDLFILFEAV